MTATIKSTNKKEEIFASNAVDVAVGARDIAE
jgi:hypothetical protein